MVAGTVTVENWSGRSRLADRVAGAYRDGRAPRGFANYLAMLEDSLEGSIGE